MLPARFPHNLLLLLLLSLGSQSTVRLHYLKTVRLVGIYLLFKDYFLVFCYSQFYIAHFVIFGFGELLITNNLFNKCKQNVTANLNAQVVETSVTVNDNSPIQDYVHPDHQTHLLFKWISLINFSLQRFPAKRTRKATVLRDGKSKRRPKVGLKRKNVLRH